MPRREGLAAGLGLTLVVLVVIVAAGIRLESGIPGLRLVHRIAASLEVIVVLWIAWMDWRRPAVLFALTLTALLSVVGIIGGQQPPPAIAAVNLLGGLSLAALFAWLLGRPRAGGDRAVTPILTPILPLLAVQLGLGAWLAIVGRSGMALPAHGLLAMALSGVIAWAALARIGGRLGKALFALALAAPLAGFTALHYEHSAAAALVHAAAAALLLVSAVCAARRGA